MKSRNHGTLLKKYSTNAQLPEKALQLVSHKFPEWQNKAHLSPDCKWKNLSFHQKFEISEWVSKMKKTSCNIQEFSITSSKILWEKIKMLITMKYYFTLLILLVTSIAAIAQERKKISNILTPKSLANFKTKSINLQFSKKCVRISNTLKG